MKLYLVEWSLQQSRIQADIEILIRERIQSKNIQTEMLFNLSWITNYECIFVGGQYFPLTFINRYNVNNPQIREILY